MKNVLILAASFRKNGNSAALAKEFARGASQNNNVEMVYLADKRIAFCRGCMACQKTLKCVIADDAVEIAEKMKQADVLVFATPVYYYSISGQLKTMIDRANAVYNSQYKFRDVYLLATAAEDEDYTVEGALKAVQGFVDCYEKSKLAGVVFAGGVNNPGEIQGHKALEEAYQLGLKL